MYSLEISNTKTKRRLNEVLEDRRPVDLQLPADALCWLHRP